MTLRALLRRRPDTQSTQHATVTVATPATVSRNASQVSQLSQVSQSQTVQSEAQSQPSVATVASVIVASVPIAKPAIDPFAEYLPAIRSGVLQQCHACRQFTKLIPVDVDDLGVPDAGWCRRYHVATDPLLPFWCDGYSPIVRSNRGAK